jgi:hypothetical protein
MTGVSGIDNLDDLLAVEGVDVFFIVLYWPGRSNSEWRAAPRRASFSSLPYNNRTKFKFIWEPDALRLLSRREISRTHGWQRGKHGIFGIHNLNLGEGHYFGRD